MALGSANAGQIAQISELGGLNDFTITNSGTGTVTLSANSQVGFTYSASIFPPTIFGINQRNATFTFTATSTAAGANTAGFDVESGFAGSFTIIDNTLGTNLLSGTFGVSKKGTLSGLDGGGSATFSDSTTVPLPNEVTYSSDYLDFSLSVDRNFSISLSNLVPVLTLDGSGFANSGSAALTGTFAANPLPTGNTPEPATLTLFGSALVGLGLIGRKRLARR